MPKGNGLFPPGELVSLVPQHTDPWSAGALKPPEIRRYRTYRERLNAQTSLLKQALGLWEAETPPLALSLPVPAADLPCSLRWQQGHSSPFYQGVSCVLAKARPCYPDCRRCPAALQVEKLQPPQLNKKKK